MTNISWWENNDLFRSEARIGQKWSERVALDLNKEKINCHTNILEFSKNENDRSRFENEQDIILDHMSGCIEVKSRRLKFTSDPNSYPYSTAYVDTVMGWDRKSPKPIAVILISQITGAKLVVPVSTQHKWKKNTAYDRIRKITETSYVVNKSELRTFSDLTTWLSSKQMANEQGKPQ